MRKDLCLKCKRKKAEEYDRVADYSQTVKDALFCYTLNKKWWCPATKDMILETDEVPVACPYRLEHIVSEN